MHTVNIEMLLHFPILHYIPSTFYSAYAILHIYTSRIVCRRQMYLYTLGISEYSAQKMHIQIKMSHCMAPSISLTLAIVILQFTTLAR